MSDGQLAMNTNLVSPGLFLKDSNGDLVKVGPVHVGTTAPNATPGAGGQAGNSKGEQWLDTSSSRYVFKIWDGTAWRTEDGEFVNVSGDLMTGALGIIAGAAATPGLYFSGDTNTGIFSPGADQVAISTNAVERVEFGTAGVVFNDGGANYDFRIEGDTNSSLFFVDASAEAVGIGTTSPTDTLHIASTGECKLVIGNEQTNTDGRKRSAIIKKADNNLEIRASEGTANAQEIIFTRTTAAESARIDSSGRLLVGTSTAVSVNNIAAGFELHALTTTSGASASIARFNNDDSGPQLNFGKSRNGGTLSPGTVVQSNDNLGEISFCGDDGTDITSRAATIACQVDGTPGANDMPGRLVFSTTADGASTPTERMRIDSRGNVFLNTSTPTSTIWADGEAVFNTGYVGSNGSFGMDIVGNGYRNTAGGWTSLNQNGNIGRSMISLRPTANGGAIYLGADNLTTGVQPTIQMQVDGSGVSTLGASTKYTAATDSATAVTLTAASIIDGIRSGTPTASVNYTLPTGTNLDAAFQGLEVGQSFEWSVINRASVTFNITLVANTTHTVFGNMITGPASSGRFLTRKSATNTFVTYRIS
jgi:hypothetical protein